MAAAVPPSWDEPEDSPPPHEEERPPPRRPKTFGRRMQGWFKDFRVENMTEYAGEHQREMISYAILAFGIVLLFVFPLLGEALIGTIFAIYFTAEIWSVIFDYDEYIQELGMTRSLILAGVLAAFFIQAPGIFIGAILTLIVKYFIVTEDNNPPSL